MNDLSAIGDKRIPENFQRKNPHYAFGEFCTAERGFHHEFVTIKERDVTKSICKHCDESVYLFHCADLTEEEEKAYALET